MRVDHFDYLVPPALIAQTPSPDREQARLLVPKPVHSDVPFLHTTVANLVEHLTPGTLVVVNDTRVLGARILGERESTLGKCEVFLVKRRAVSPVPGALADDSGAERWTALARASKPLRVGSRVLAGPLVIEFEGRVDDRLFEVCLRTSDGSPVEDARRRVGQVPLPPYIRRGVNDADQSRYQTVYARSEGAVAAPTAGLHLTKGLMDRIEARGCEIATCTLHVGLGTFQPVTVEDLDDHPMHSESFEVTEQLAESIARARTRGAPVLAIGTTVVRALESARCPMNPGHVRATAGETKLLIQPGYAFSVVDRLLTNFHLPKSTLLAMVCAFAGTQRVLDVYRTAVRERYRFFSYGDAMLLDRERAEG